MDFLAKAWAFFVYVPLPYIAIAVFIGGLIYRIRHWIALPRSAAKVYPVALSSVGAVGKVTGDVILFRKTFNGSKSLWAMAYVFHMGLALIVVGHFRTTTEVSWLWNLFGLAESEIERVSFVLGMTAGIAILTGAFLLLARRFITKWRVLSLFEDYFILVLLLAVILTGLDMRLFSEVDITEIRQYAISVLTFHPAAIVSNTVFLWHFLLAQIVIIYFPFSKLIHVISKAVTESWTVR